MTRARAGAQHQQPPHGALRPGPREHGEKSTDPSRHDLDQLQATAGNAAVTTMLGHGLPLAPEVRAHMEGRFGESFKDVRIHDDPNANAAAAKLGAKAFTHGSDIGFGASRFAPHSVEGKRLLAHELAHVIQQRRGVGAPSHAQRGELERDAASAADAMANGAARIPVTAVSTPAVMLDPVDDYDAEVKRERREQRRSERKDKRQRRQERADARNPQMGRDMAERELRNMERSLRSPGGNQRSPGRQREEFERFKRLLDVVGGSEVQKSRRLSAFHEAQRTGSKAVGQGEYVAGGERLPDQQVMERGRPVASHTRPDVSMYRRMPDGTLKRTHTNLKAHRLEKMNVYRARSASRQILYQAVANKAHLPQGESLVIEFQGVPDAEIKKEILHELFRQNTPIDEVRFGSEAHRNTDYNPAGGREPLDTDADDRRRRQARERQERRFEKDARDKAEKAHKKADAARDRQGKAADDKAYGKKSKKSSKKSAGKAEKKGGKKSAGNAKKKGSKKAAGKAKKKSSSKKSAGTAGTKKAKAKQLAAGGKKAAAPETKAPVEAAKPTPAPEAKAQAAEPAKPAAPEKPVVTESAKAPAPVEAPKAAPASPTEVRAPVAEPKPSGIRGAVAPAVTAATALAALPAIKGIASKIHGEDYLGAAKDAAELGLSFVPSLAPVFVAKGMISEYWGPEHEKIQERANEFGDFTKGVAEYTPIGLIPYGPEVVGGLGAATYAVAESGVRTVYHMGEAVVEGGEMVVEGIAEGAEAAWDWLNEGPSWIEMYEQAAREHAED